MVISKKKSACCLIIQHSENNKQTKDSVPDASKGQYAEIC